MISIVDDDESVREATKGLVRSLGYNAATFSSAEEFLSSDQIQDTSCLITDVQMPGLSGVELQSALIAGGRDLPVIFVTAYPEHLLTGQHPEPAFVLGKPFDPTALAAASFQAVSAGRKTF